MAGLQMTVTSSFGRTPCIKWTTVLTALSRSLIGETSGQGASARLVWGQRQITSPVREAMSLSECRIAAVAAVSDLDRSRPFEGTLGLSAVDSGAGGDEVVYSCGEEPA